MLGTWPRTQTADGFVTAQAKCGVKSFKLEFRSISSLNDEKSPQIFHWKHKEGMFSSCHWHGLILLNSVANSSVTALMLTWKLATAQHQAVVTWSPRTPWLRRIECSAQSHAGTQVLCWGPGNRGQSPGVPRSMRDTDTITVTTKVLEESLHMIWERTDTSHPQPGQRFLLSPGPHLDDLCMPLSPVMALTLWHLWVDHILPSHSAPSKARSPEGSSVDKHGFWHSSR